LASKAAEVREADTWLRNSSALRALLNHRQVALVQHALKHPYEAYTVRAHMISHHVTYETARTDLLQLAEQGLLEKTTRGRAYVFIVPHDLQDRLSAVAKA
jgi:DeoR/GlpR family transcriptional regulator of sugar metabolism